MRHNPLILLVTGLLALAMVACGSDGDAGGEATTPSASESSSPDLEPSADETGGETQSDDAGAPATGAGGSFTFGGQTLGVDEVRRCMSDFVDFDLQALAQGAQLMLAWSPGRPLDVSLQGQAVREATGSNSFSAFVESGWAASETTVTGTATVTDSYDVEDPVEVTFEVAIPAESIDCSL